MPRCRLPDTGAPGESYQNLSPFAWKDGMQEDKGDVMFFLERKSALEGSGKRLVVYGNEKAFLSMSIP